MPETFTVTLTVEEWDAIFGRFGCTEGESLDEPLDWEVKQKLHDQLGPKFAEDSEEREAARHAGQGKKA